MADTQYEGEVTGWTGWIAFAAFMMILGGCLNAFYGLVALLNDTWVGWNTETANAVVLDLTQWGWVHLILGSLVVLAGIGVLSGNMAARVVGVILAIGSAITNFMFIPVYPIWSITIITIDVLVIWALTAHGREMKSV